MSTNKAYIGLDVHKDTIAVAIAPTNQNNNEVRFFGNIPNTPDHLKKLVKKLHEHYQELEFSYEAGPCGYIIYRQLIEWKLSSDRLGSFICNFFILPTPTCFRLVGVNSYIDWPKTVRLRNLRNKNLTAFIQTSQELSNFSIACVKHYCLIG